jgi:integration host factor subunit alpha
LKLTKAQIVDSVSDQIGFTKIHSFEIIEILLEIMKKALESGDDVLISNFGKFCVRAKKERRGRNPSTGADMLLRPRRVVTFKWSGKLKKRLNGQPG